MDDLTAFLLAREDEREAGAPSEHFVGSESQVHRCPAARDPEWCGDLEHGEENCDCGSAPARPPLRLSPRLSREVAAMSDVEREMAREQMCVESGGHLPPATLNGIRAVVSDGEAWIDADALDKYGPDFFAALGGGIPPENVHPVPDPGAAPLDIRKISAITLCPARTPQPDAA